MASNTTRIQIFKVNDARSGTSSKTQKPWTMQDCEVGICSANGSIEQVGVLMLAKSMTDGKDEKGNVVARAPQPGLYDAVFTLGTDRERRVIAMIETLIPAQPRSAATSSAAASGKPTAS